MKDDLLFLQLWDLYSPLLTKNQREVTDLYFNYDLSLAEIAEQKGVSRQSVSDCLNKCRKQLEEYDKKLALRQLIDKGDSVFSAYMTTVNRWIDKQKQENSEPSAVIELEQSLAGLLQEFDVEVLREE